MVLSRRLGWLIGRLHYVANSRMSKISRENIQLCLPQLTADECEQLVEQSLQETAKVMCETPAIWRSNPSQIEKRIVSVNHGGLMQAAVAEGKGVIVVIPHLGNWELLGAHLPSYGEVTCLYRPPQLTGVGEFIRRARQGFGMKTAPTNRKGVAALLKSLKAGEITAILPDQVPQAGSGEFANFFGQPALTMTLLANLVARTDCRLVMGYAKRVERGFEIVFKDVDPDCYSSETDISLTALNSSVEDCVSDAPAQYQWEYKRFRKQPEGQPKRYQFKC